MKVLCCDLSSVHPSLSNYYNFALNIYEQKSSPLKSPIYKIICFYSVSREYSSAFSLALPLYNYYVYSQNSTSCFVILTVLSNPISFNLIDNFNLTDICVLTNTSPNNKIQYCFYDLYDRSSISCLLSNLNLTYTTIFTGISRADSEWFTRNDNIQIIPLQNSYSSPSNNYHYQCYVSYGSYGNHDTFPIYHKNNKLSWILSSSYIQNNS